MDYLSTKPFPCQKLSSNDFTQNFLLVEHLEHKKLRNQKARKLCKLDMQQTSRYSTNLNNTKHAKRFYQNKRNTSSSKQQITKQNDYAIRP